MNQFFTSGGQRIGASASVLVLPVNIQGCFPLGWTDLILHFKGLLRVFSSTTIQKHQRLWHSAFLMVQFSHPYMTTGETIALTIWTFVGKVMSLLFNILSSNLSLTEIFIFHVLFKLLIESSCFTSSQNFEDCVFTMKILCFVLFQN